jgi:predicted heme/steroid binding protein
MRKFTLEHLTKNNGKNGAPVYIAYEGKVYDVSNSFLWRWGRHQAQHDAGVECTEAIEDAPHGPDLLSRYPIIGELMD